MSRKIRTKTNAETEERLIIRRLGKGVGALCGECGRGVRMVTLEEAIVRFGVNSQVIYGLVEARQIHFSETAERTLLVCPDSLGRNALSQDGMSCVQNTEEVTREVASCQSPPEPSLADKLAYTRALYGNLIEWYKSADGKAQVILSLDGALLAFLTAAIFTKSGDFKAVIDAFGVETWVSLIAMSATLLASMACAILCLWSFFASAARTGRVS